MCQMTKSFISLKTQTGILEEDEAYYLSQAYSGTIFKDTAPLLYSLSYGFKAKKAIDSLRSKGLVKIQDGKVIVTDSILERMRDTLRSMYEKRFGDKLWPHDDVNLYRMMAIILPEKANP